MRLLTVHVLSATWHLINLWDYKRVTRGSHWNCILETPHLLNEVSFYCSPYIITIWNEFLVRFFALPVPLRTQYNPKQLQIKSVLHDLSTKLPRSQSTSAHIKPVCLNNQQLLTGCWLSNSSFYSQVLCDLLHGSHLESSNLSLQCWMVF